MKKLHIIAPNTKMKKLQAISPSQIIKQSRPQSFQTQKVHDPDLNEKLSQPLSTNQPNSSDQSILPKL
jgi:hypothetical protein